MGLVLETEVTEQVTKETYRILQICVEANMGVIGLIKILRQIQHDQGKDSGLKDCRDFIKRHFNY